MSRRTTRREFLRSAGILAGAAVGGRLLPAAATEQAPRPNIVLIMADDMGFSDIGCYGGEIRTPVLDRLAAGGVRFTQFYNTGRCCPTRACLMTGLYPHQAGVGHMMQDRGTDGYRGDLNGRCVTIAEVLAPAGYGTYMSGKWHVTRFTGPDGPKHNWPQQRGFDGFFGTITGAGSFWTPGTLTEGNTQIDPPEGFYYTDAISDRAATFIADHQAKRPDDPLFLYVAYTAPHWPLHAPKETIDRYRGRYAGGWDALRAERHKRMIDMGLVKASWEMTPRDNAADAWKKVPADKREEMGLRMAVYAAQIDRMDQGIGRIVDALKKAGRLEDTLILFLADNGGCAEGGPWGFERKRGGTLGTDSSFASYGLSWANASNTPFRRYKHWVHEGGIATPLVVHWPAGVGARGELRHQQAHLIDIMATCVDLAGAEYPRRRAGQDVQPMEGVSLRGAFAGEPVDRDQALYWEHEGNRAMREGKWKLVAKGRGGPWELYDMEADRTELHDLAEKHPDRLAKMAAAWETWAKRTNVLPWPGRRRRRASKDVGSKATRFELKGGDSLPREKCPRVAGKAVTVTVHLAATGEGVLLAQGGSSLGYALAIAKGRPALAVRDRGRLTRAEATGKLPAGPCVVVGRLGADGKMAVSVDGREVATAKAPGPISEMPLDGLQVGRDLKGAVGDYEVPNAFTGKVIKAIVELGD